MTIIYVVFEAVYKMIMDWIKKHSTLLIGILTCIGFLFYCYACEPKVHSLTDRSRLVNRQELQLELDQFIGMAQLRVADLDKQEQLRAIILQNALVLVQGQPLNPVGIITAIAAVYGAAQGSKNIKQGVKNARAKRKNNANAG